MMIEVPVIPFEANFKAFSIVKLWRIHKIDLVSILKILQPFCKKNNGWKVCIKTKILKNCNISKIALYTYSVKMV